MSTPRPTSRRFGPYPVLGRIGCGGMAEVHLALSVSPCGAERLVVVKALHPHLAEDAPSKAMFLDEARVLTMLSHPSLLHIYDSGYEGEEPYLVVEYLDGLTLSELVRASSAAKKRPSPSLIVHIFAEIAAGLAHAHAARTLDGAPLGFVHRDVSPSNVMVLRSGHAKLIDFGVAKTTRNLATTDIGCVKGKPRYVAPELIDGARPSAAADVWALGVLLWETLAQRPLFDGEGLLEVLTAVREAPIPPASEHAPGVNRALDAIIAKALQRDPSARCSMSDLCDALRRWLQMRTPQLGAEDVARFVAEVGRARLAQQSSQIRAWLLEADALRPPRPQVAVTLRPPMYPKAVDLGSSHDRDAAGSPALRKPAVEAASGLYDAQPAASRERTPRPAARPDSVIAPRPSCANDRDAAAPAAPQKKPSTIRPPAPAVHTDEPCIAPDFPLRPPPPMLDWPRPAQEKTASWRPPRSVTSTPPPPPPAASFPPPPLPHPSASPSYRPPAPAAEDDLRSRAGRRTPSRPTEMVPPPASTPKAMNARPRRPRRPTPALTANEAAMLAAATRSSRAPRDTKPGVPSARDRKK
ncbi:MAG: protein kinase [Myxococcales bacterium]|nr:protein kinase [Myxococcales bacterium]